MKRPAATMDSTSVRAWDEGWKAAKAFGQSKERDLESIRAYAGRAWDEVARAKAEFWVTRKANLSPLEVLELVDRLRRHVATLRPDWPSPAERTADLNVHSRVSLSLSRVPAGVRT